VLILNRASTSGSSGEWKHDGYDVLADGVVVGRIMKAIAAPEGTPWLWAVAHGFIENRRPTHGHEATPEAAMAAFAKSWRREAKVKNPTCPDMRGGAAQVGRTRKRPRRSGA
jgi:hypothetical protein